MLFSCSRPLFPTSSHFSIATTVAFRLLSIALPSNLKLVSAICVVFQAPSSAITFGVSMVTRGFIPTRRRVPQTFTELTSTRSSQPGSNRSESARSGWDCARIGRPESSADGRAAELDGFDPTSRGSVALIPAFCPFLCVLCFLLIHFLVKVQESQSCMSRSLVRQATQPPEASV